MNAAPTASPRFFWQGVLIVLPVAALALFALFSLRQDLAMVEHDAREKAQVEAREIADRLWATLDDPDLRAAFQTWFPSRWTTTQRGDSERGAIHSAFLFQVNPAGQLLFPPAARELPEPRPLDPDDLNEEQAALWLLAQSSVADLGTNGPGPVETLRQFVGLEPPDRFAAAARFQLGVLLSGKDQPKAAAQEFQALAKSFPESSGETGLPLPPLALLKAAEQFLRLTNADPTVAGALLDAACSNAVAVPSSITPYLLRAALPTDAALSTNIVARWQALWWEHRKVIPLHAAAQPAYTAAVENAVRRRTEARARALPFPYNVPPQTKEVPPRLFWFAMPGEFGAASPQESQPSGLGAFWLATWIESDRDGYWYLCRPRFGQFLGARTMTVSDRRGGARNLLPFAAGIQTNRVNPAHAEYPFFDPFLAELEKQRARLANYLGLSLELAGRILISSNVLPPFLYTNSPKGSVEFWKKSDAPTSPPLLASAFREEDGVELLRVGIHLTRPDLLYAGQNTRTRLFGLLIVASALTALIGFTSARRAFRRQQHLAAMKSNFVSSVSHELRAPIASVRLMAESLERGKITEPVKQRDYFRFIVQECRRLGTLIENVLDFARIEQGRKQYEFEPTDLAALARQTVQLMEPMAAEREVTLNFLPFQRSNDSAPPDLQPFLDGAAIQQALVNLLDNAIKHSPPRTTVAVALEFTPQPPALLLSVQDHGRGIPAHEHEKIFERFYRCGTELRRETQGVGIGLSIVKHVIEAHGGRVRVESQVGQGSRFVIELPMKLHLPK